MEFLVDRKNYMDNIKYTIIFLKCSTTDRTAHALTFFHPEFE